MRCANCRKTEALDTKWERLMRWLMKHLFPEQVIDLTGDRYTQGFGDGYAMGFDHAKKNK